MFESSEKPRLYGVPPGADFPSVLVSMVLDAHKDAPPEALARVRILVNTRRMERRLRVLFREGDARLLPKIGLVTDVDRLVPGLALPPSISRLRRKLELTRLTKRLIETEPDLAAMSAAVDLADSLASLLDEMQGEGMDPALMSDLDVGNASEHWNRSLKFLDISRRYIAEIEGEGMDAEARRRFAVQAICNHWLANPPQDPLFIAGSTGSRTTTRLLMCGVAGLPQGAILLPGYDPDLPADVWDALSAGRDTEDHPQYRFAALLKALNVTPNDVTLLSKPPDPKRNKLISLSLRPARITHQWLSDGPGISNLQAAVQGLSLVEAAQTKDEALAISVALREAVQRKKTVALITPDRTLARRVSATMARWKIVPDDSAGIPLSLTPPGRFLRQVARAIGAELTPDVLIALMKHPFTRSAEDERGPHLRLTRQLELFFRDNAFLVITDAVLDGFEKKAGEEAKSWVSWLKASIARLSTLPERNLGAAVEHHQMTADFLADGGTGEISKLWKKDAGEACISEFQKLRQEATFDGDLPFSDYLQLFEGILNAESDRVPTLARPDVMIWGTLEARVQGADIVVLAGLNEGVWPEANRPDPWLNRTMRRDLGLLLPEGQVGLAAHDYQQAAAAPEVVLCRSKRGEDGEAVPSRWLNRLTNLLSGLADHHGPEALQDMKDRGNRLLQSAAALDRPRTPIDPEKRPAPAPPINQRPKKLSVTEITRLIRDPYAIYARHVLGLKPLQTLLPKPDARLKGIVFHEIVRAFFDPIADFDDPDAARSRLRKIIGAEFARSVPWPSIQNHWSGQLAQIADHLISGEQNRRRNGQLVAAEVPGEMAIGADHGIRGKADRIDRLATGGLAIFDYKTGTVPKKPDVKRHDRQLLIEAVMAEAGAFDKLTAAPVELVSYIHLGRSSEDFTPKLEDGLETETVSRELAQLLARYADERTGYISRRAMEKVRYDGDYDHLARFGEWDASATTTPEPMT
jgi:double-strand break repair protein AddB